MSQEIFRFDLIANEGEARAGIFHTPHGDIQTPVFAPVGTQATVKAVTPVQLAELGASLVLSNTYHLYLRPGADIVRQMGGLHRFMNWPHPMLTDSGGFQVFSLTKIRKIDEDGVTFKSHIDGSMHRLTPETSIEIQEKLGADIIMAFDECAPPYERAYNEEALQRTQAWAVRCLRAKTCPDQALFGIVQGGIFPDLRERSAEWTAAQGFPGHAIGGLSVGETKQEMHAMIEVVNRILPRDRPRYLMGVGSPEDLINGIARGIDIFDCVLPTRLARHQSAMTLTGRVNLLNAVHAADSDPIDPACGCYTCRNFSRAYLRHLLAAREMLASTLISIHNLFMLIHLVKMCRDAIIEQRFETFAAQFLENYKPNRK
jgi:queuine tRNA-ribosyltransferase